jgi:FlaA1/EpsC-like NDP-sugar epimerase
VALAFSLATLLRLEGSFYTHADKFIWNEQLVKILPIITGLKLLPMAAFGVYKRFWRYTDTDEILHLAKALLVASLIMLIPRLFGYNPHAKDLLAISYGVIIMDYLLSLTFTSGIRLLRAYLVEQKNIKKRLAHMSASARRTLLIGAGEACLQVIKAIDSHPELGLNLVGILDDDKKKQGMNLGKNVPVLGYIKDVKFWVDELAIDEIIIAIPSLPQSERRRINLLCNETNLEVRTVPSVDQLAGGRVTVEQIRRLSMEDLLGREEIDLNLPEVLAYLRNKRVLVTGAGGSIGKELCKQLVAKCRIQSLCLLGKGENSIFETWQELLDMALSSKADYETLVFKDYQVKLNKKIADIRNYDRIESIISEFQPEVIFHAAAHKHVHLMELNPCEAFENNVLGTRNLTELAGKHSVETFVLISTDKAVNPTSIMGSTKNLAEKIVLLNSKNYPNTKYTAVRFGNVLGSRGSVIKVWEQQIKNNKPITVTHKEAIRYFMTIPEAAQLVIQAAAKANKGEIMVLDMGDPIKIYDLAKHFIQLSGFDLDEVPIEIIGLKDGEKLYEELLTASEFIESKLTEKIFKAKIDFKVDDRLLINSVTEMEKLAKANNREACSLIMKNFVHNKLSI